MWFVYSVFEHYSRNLTVFLFRLWFPTALKEGTVTLRLTLIDTQGFGDQIGRADR